MSTIRRPWSPERPPAPIVPMPVTTVVDPAGARAIFGAPGRGWRHDFRLVRGPYERDGRTVVDLCTEIEWYRRQILALHQEHGAIEPWLRERLEVPAGSQWPVLAERVWVEVVAPAAPAVEGRAPATVLDRVVSLDAPPTQQPVSIREAPRLSGHRLVVVTPDAQRRDLRAVSELHERDGGGWYVLVVEERKWYRTALTSERFTPFAAPVHLCWVE